eukprot:8490346-Alexandrium_andersonii.AAC.1
MHGAQGSGAGGGTTLVVSSSSASPHAPCWVNEASALGAAPLPTSGGRGVAAPLSATRKGKQGAAAAGHSTS